VAVIIAWHPPSARDFLETPSACDHFCPFPPQRETKEDARDLDTYARLPPRVLQESQRIFPVLEFICEQIDAEDERRARASATRASSEAAAENKRRAAAGGLGGTTLGYSLDDLPEVPTGAPYSSQSGRRGSGGSAVTAAVMPPLYPPPADAAPAGLYAPSAPPLPSAGDFYSGYGGEAAVAAAGGGVGGAAALQDAFRRLKLDQVRFLLWMNDGRIFFGGACFHFRRLLCAVLERNFRVGEVESVNAYR